MAAVSRILFSPLGENQVLSLQKDGLLALRNSELSGPNAGHIIESYSSDRFKNHTALDWAPSNSRSKCLAAVGLNHHESGVVVSVVDMLAHGGPKVQELKFTRSCRALSFNPLDANFLAVGCEKGRDASFYICNLQESSTHELGDSQARRGPLVRTPSRVGASSSSTTTRPHTEYTIPDTINSIAWLPAQPYCLLVGAGNKDVFRIDTRDSGFHPLEVKCGTQCLAVDPLSMNLIASFSQSSIKIFDVRKGNEALQTIPNCPSISKLHWSPTRPYSLVALSKDLETYNLLENVDRDKPCVTTVLRRMARQVSYSEKASGTFLCDFDLHPLVPNRIATINTFGAVDEFMLADPVSASFSPRGFAACNLSDSSDIVSLVTDEVGNEDISTVMRKRAVQGYALDVDMNVKVSAGNNEVHGVWRWIQETKNEVAVLYGVRQIFALNTSDPLLASVPRVVKSHVEYNQTLITPVVSSPQRTLCQLLCGWGALHTEAIKPIVASVCERGEHERGAALALFHQNLPLAVECLDLGIKANPSLAAIYSLASMSFYAHDSDEWKDRAPALYGNANFPPYLKACFDFLSGDVGAILTNPSILLHDRVAFACRYLNDQKLVSVVASLESECLSSGSLVGLLITGFTETGVKLLQSFIDRTCDLQTASLVASHAAKISLNNPSIPIPEDIKLLSVNPSIVEWVDLYRDLLDSWQLWHERARFDMARTSSGLIRPPPQTSVRCAFCGNAVNVAKIRDARRAPKGGPPKVTSTLCLNCPNLLPRCALCLLSLTVRATPPVKNSESSSDALQRQNLDNLFSWCQTCRHGGHAAHIEDWFSTHSSCPVGGCNCPCKGLDLVHLDLSSQ